MSDDPTTGLLAAEEAAAQLVSDLTALRREVQHYDSAGKSLAEARDSVGRLVERLSEVAEEVSVVASAIGAIGAPQIIAAVERVGAASAAGSSETAALIESHHNRADVVLKQITKGVESEANRLDNRVRSVRGLVILTLLLALLACALAGAVLYMLLTGTGKA